jgi:hypothetical protein
MTSGFLSLQNRRKLSKSIGDRVGTIGGGHEHQKMTRTSRLDQLQSEENFPYFVIEHFQGISFDLRKVSGTVF